MFSLKEKVGGFFQERQKRAREQFEWKERINKAIQNETAGLFGRLNRFCTQSEDGATPTQTRIFQAASQPHEIEPTLRALLNLTDIREERELVFSVKSHVPRINFGLKIPEYRGIPTCGETLLLIACPSTLSQAILTVNFDLLRTGEISYESRIDLRRVASGTIKEWNSGAGCLFDRLQVGEEMVNLLLRCAEREIKARDATVTSSNLKHE